MNQTTAQSQMEVSATPAQPLLFQVDPTFWTIISIAILVRVILGYPIQPRQ